MVINHVRKHPEVSTPDKKPEKKKSTTRGAQPKDSGDEDPDAGGE